MTSSLLNLTEPLIETPLESTPPERGASAMPFDGFGRGGMEVGSGREVGENIWIGRVFGGLGDGDQRASRRKLFDS
jgi:hypothetical protein